MEYLLETFVGPEVNVAVSRLPEFILVLVGTFFLELKLDS